MEDVRSKVSSVFDSAGRKIKKILMEYARELFPDDTFPKLAFKVQLGTQNIALEVKGILVDGSLENPCYIVLMPDGLYEFSSLDEKTTNLDISAAMELDVDDYNKYAYQVIDALTRAKNHQK